MDKNDGEEYAEHMEKLSDKEQALAPNDGASQHLAEMDQAVLAQNTANQERTFSLPLLATTSAQQLSHTRDFQSKNHQTTFMKHSEYETQAYVNAGLNQQHGLDSPEGSAALLQANKPEVDGTDIQKAQFLAKVDDKQPTVRTLGSDHPKKIIPRTLSPIPSTKRFQAKKS